MPKRTPEGLWNNLEGKFFHSFEEDRSVKWQGWIIAQVKDGIYLIDRFEWITGGRSFTGKVLVPIEQMLREQWTFYETEVEMRESYQYSGIAQRNGR